MDNILKDGERIDDLQYKGYTIIQNPKYFCFGIDAVLLANFIKVKKDAKVLDFGTGTGIIPILIAAKTKASEVIGIEIQEALAEMANRSLKLNSIEDRVKIINEDLKNSTKILPLSNYDIITCNPPYKNNGTGIVNPHDSLAISRHEIMCNLEDVVSVSSKLLKFNGKLCVIHRPQRLVDIVTLMRKYKIEPKRIRFVHPNIKKRPTMVLVEGARSGNAELIVEEPLFVYDLEGNYSEEINKIYDRGM